MLFIKYAVFSLQSFVFVQGMFEAVFIAVVVNMLKWLNFLRVFVLVIAAYIAVVLYVELFYNFLCCLFISIKHKTWLVDE
jgi:hypothetical protein